MAVEATHTHLNPFTHQMIQHRDNLMSQQMGFTDIPLPAGNNSVYYEAKTESGLTYSTNYTRPAVPRKRPVDQLYQQHYQLDIDTIISHHTKRIRVELEERQKQETRVLVGAIGEGAMRRLKEKEEQIDRMRRMNAALEEKVKALYAEAQLWRDLAQTNQATANSLRVDLQHALARVDVDVDVEEEESCCSSSTAASAHAVERAWCRVCGEREPCVLMLPCRHLCLCDVCGSGSQQIHACPVCNTTTKATLHLNMSMS